jgi:hypothetical protein
VSVDYQQRWLVRASVSGFGEDICGAWVSEYRAWAEPDPEDLVVVDPRNGFSYLFDLAGTLRGEFCSRAPRVVGVWGCPGLEHADATTAGCAGTPGPAGLPMTAGI